jgi:hypothetical protein
MGSIRRLALLCTLFGAAAQAQSPSSGNADGVPRTQTVTNAPAGYVGRKTTDRQTRVGHTPGDSSTFVLTIGGFVRECPTADGRVAGTFEYTLTSDEVETVDGETQRRHYAINLALELEGHTRPDGLLDLIDVRGNFSRQLHGEPAEQHSVSTRFRVGAQGQPDMAALEEAVRATADISIAAAMWMASTIYTDAQSVWIRPNACVEIAFDPPTDSRFVGPNGSVDVRVVLRTKAEKEPIGDAPLQIQAIGAIGTVSPRQAVTDAGTPVTVTYTASADPRNGHGVDAAAAASHAGPGFGLWHIRAAVPYEGTFTQTGTTSITGANVSEPFASSAQAYGVGVSRNEEITGRLVWTPEPSSTRAGSFGDVGSVFYVPTAGEIRVHVHAEGRSIAGRCTHEGTRTFAIDALPPDALRYVLLEIAADGRYKLWLGMISFYLQFEAEEKCEVRLGRNTSGTITINDAAIVLGLQEGALTGDTIAGAPAAPIVFPPHQYTGSWEFKKQTERRP